MSNIVKVCINCGDLDSTQVYFSKDKKRMQCKSCHNKGHERNRERDNKRINEYIKNDRKTNPEKYAERQRKYHKKYRTLITEKTIIRGFDITIDQYRKMFIDQDNKCFICKKEETKISHHSGKIARLSLDHNHETNKIRKLLCHNCNIMIGASKESIEILQEAINYLKEFKDDNERE